DLVALVSRFRTRRGHAHSWLLRSLLAWRDGRTSRGRAPGGKGAGEAPGRVGLSVHGGGGREVPPGVRRAIQGGGRGGEADDLAGRAGPAGSDAKGRSRRRSETVHPGVGDGGGADEAHGDLRAWGEVVAALPGRGRQRVPQGVQDCRQALLSPANARK